MNQIVTVVKISGDASKAVRYAFQRWSEARVASTDEPTLMEPGQWPAGCRDEMGQFAQHIRANAGQLPIVFWNEHVDMWSMGDVFRNAFPWNANSLFEVQSDNSLNLLCYAIPDGNLLHAHLGRELRRKGLAQEAKWYLQILHEAATARCPVVEEAAIVVVRQVIGGLVADDEAEEARHSIPAWLRRYNTA